MSSFRFIYFAFLTCTSFSTFAVEQNFVSSAAVEKSDLEKNLDAIQDYESVLNKYTKYLAEVPKEVKEEELKSIAEVEKVDKEIAQLRHKKAKIKSALSDACRKHRYTKMLFEKRLREFSGEASRYSDGFGNNQRYNYNKDYSKERKR